MTTTSHITTRTPAHACPFPETGCTASSCPHPLDTPGAVFAAVNLISERVAPSLSDETRRALVLDRARVQRRPARSRVW